MDDKVDISFAIDCTSSMDSYIDSVKQNIENWTQQIFMPDIDRVRVGLVEYRDHPEDSCSFVTRKHESMPDIDRVQVGLVEYRDHPGETFSFVTRKHDFAHSASTLKDWLSCCSTDGGYDIPEAVADALNDVLHLSWRPDATKICILICDAPPHGLLLDKEDRFQQCPCGHDPVSIASKMAKTGIALYIIGFALTGIVEDFFMALAFKTGGQYIPLRNAEILAEVIQGGVEEEISLEKLMSEVNKEVREDLEDQQVINIEELSRRNHEKMKFKGARAKQMIYRKQVAKITSRAKMLSKFKTIQEMREECFAQSTVYVRDPNNEEANKFAFVEGGITIEQSERMIIKAVARWT